MQAVLKCTASEETIERLRRRQAEAQTRLCRLTRCEYRILELIAQGYLNKMIACELNRSIKTVEKHRGKLMRKLECGSLSELLQLWFVLNWDQM